MADFPDLPQLAGTDFTPLDETVVQESPGGERRTINPHGTREDVGWMDIVLGPLDVPADKATLDAHFDGHQFESFNFVLQSRPSITWVLMWLDPPAYRDIAQDGSVVEARMRLAVKSNDEF